MEKVLFGAGCFWGVEERFGQLAGVVATCVGYAGGTTTNPTYEDVCSKNTGHAEVVQVEYDPAQIDFSQLLDFFWSSHNPTLQHSSQYRSLIGCATPEQAALAHKHLEQLAHSDRYTQPPTTEIVESAIFYPAEDYHQQYYAKHRKGFGKRT